MIQQYLNFQFLPDFELSQSQIPALYHKINTFEIQVVYNTINIAGKPKNLKYSTILLHFNTTKPVTGKIIDNWVLIHLFFKSK